jgi:peptide/nickel transport system permease protein
MIPILTNVPIQLLMLIMGNMLLENFFSIPGLGGFTIMAIAQQDFAIVRSMVFLGSALYCIGLLLTDICYSVVDPRVRLE